MLEELKAVGITLLVLAILFGLAAGAALFFTTFDGSVPVDQIWAPCGLSLIPAEFLELSNYRTDLPSILGI
jgi:hypothetical protein